MAFQSKLQIFPSGKGSSSKCRSVSVIIFQGYFSYLLVLGVGFYIEEEKDIQQQLSEIKILLKAFHFYSRISWLIYDNSNNIQVFYINFMRSLFTTDIPGAVPRNRYYDKDLFAKKHQQEINRFGPHNLNPEHKRNIQWHMPKQRLTQPVDRNSSIIKPHSLHYRSQSDQIDKLSKSVIINRIDERQITGKVTDGISMRNSSSILSNAAKKSLGESFTRDIQENPYFPHRLPKKHEENRSLLTGRRGWNYDNVETYEVPGSDKHYFPKWS